MDTRPPAPPAKTTAVAAKAATSPAVPRERPRARAVALGGTGWPRGWLLRLRKRARARAIALGVALALTALIMWPILVWLNNSKNGSPPTKDPVEIQEVPTAAPGVAQLKEPSRTKDPVEIQAVLTGHDRPPQVVAFAPNGKWAVSAEYGPGLLVWDLDKRKKVAGLSTGSVLALTVLPDNKTIAVNEGWFIEFWEKDKPDKPAKANFSIETAHHVLDLAVTPDGRWLAAAGSDGTVRVWNLKTDKPQKLGKHSGEALSVAFSPDGKYLVTGSKDKTVQLWDIEREALAGTFEGHTGEVCKVGFSKNGQQIYSVGRGSEADHNVVRVWERKNRNKEVRSFAAPGGERQKCVAFSADGVRALTGCSDGKLILWELEGGKQIEVFPGHNDGVLSVAFSPDGRWALSGGYDKKVRLWKLPATQAPSPEKTTERGVGQAGRPES